MRIGEHAALITFVLVLVAAACAVRSPTRAKPAGRQLVSFPASDGGIVYAHRYGEGSHGVVLAHGGQFDKESWEPQARELVEAGFLALAIDLRGYGQSRSGGQANGGGEDLYLDVLAAIRYLRETGVERVSVVGASMGGWAAAEASVETEPGEIDRLVLLAHSSIERPEGMRGRKLFVTTRGDFSGGGILRLPRIREQFERAPEPKQLVILEGSAHAQHVFATEQGPQLMQQIIRFLSTP